MNALKYSLIALIALGAVATAVSTTAQIPDEFTNLEILPKDMKKRELVQVMRGFASALGKRCNYCHVGEDPSSLEGYDFASDDKEPKRIARIMMKMTADINGTHLSKLDENHTTKVRCITCHHGVETPETIDNVILAVVDEEGADAAIATYREMREAHYGSASYNFNAGPLNNVAENLADARSDLAGAIAVMQMNIEFNPDQPFSHLYLGQLYMASGDKEAAIASVEKCLELDPGNRWAQGTLEKMKSAE
jgi:hypothetical protein